MANPLKKIFQNSSSRSSVKPFEIVATRTAPITTPRIVPDPPNTFTPPITTAVDDGELEAVRRAGVERREARREQEAAETGERAESAKAVITRRPAGMPAKRAASGFEPIA